MTAKSCNPAGYESMGDIALAESESISNGGNGIPGSDGAKVTSIEQSRPGVAVEQGVLPGCLLLPVTAFKEVRLRVEPADQAVWCWMEPKGRPSFTFSLLLELNQMNARVKELAAGTNDAENFAPKFFVATSGIPGVFNLGGDLGFFVNLIKEQNHEALRDYAHACIRCIYEIETSLGGNVVTMCVVSGDAMGGGFEAVLSFNVIIAERGVRMGLPETVFGSFPGMGAYSLLSRRIGHVEAQRMIMSGKMYLSEELFEMGIVNYLVEPGRGIEAARDFIAEYKNRHGLLLSLNKVRRRVNPLTYEELEDITEIWVDAILKLSPTDIRRMEVLVNAQGRRIKSL